MARRKATRAADAAHNGAVLEVQDLVAAFFTRRGVVRAVGGVSFSLAAGDTLGIVGESGSGKSATALAILRSLPHPGRILGGDIRFLGEDLLLKSDTEMQRIRGRQIAMIPQDPTASLNPVMRVGTHLLEVLGVHLGLHGEAARKRAVELLDTVGIPEADRRFGEYPHQMSGGMRQRVMIAMAIACHPTLLIADEPTTALDATVQAQILELIRSLSAELHSATIMITHNLGIVAGLCDEVAVMYAGCIVERGPRDTVFFRPRHPYTVSLLRCVPRLDRVGVAELQSIPGQPPDLIRMPPGCSFWPRCPLASERCRVESPPLEAQEGPEHLSACWNADHIERMPA
ncbi:MAG: ABC transporter ATP-binding protein [Chloroflexi bacterium]|nr:ABC transporter ATP-binding protein [Chloroflexota bacterium]